MRFIAGRAIFRHAVMVMITVAQPPVIISDQLWVHLSQPRLIASGFVDFHHRPRRQTRLGVALIPVGTLPAALGARVIGNKIGNKTGIPWTQRIAGLDLKRKHRTDIVFRHLRIEMGHRVRLFPGVPWPGLLPENQRPVTDGVTESNFIAPAAPRQLPLRVSMAFTATRSCAFVACALVSPLFKYPSQRSSLAVR